MAVLVAIGRRNPALWAPIKEISLDRVLISTLYSTRYLSYIFFSSFVFTKVELWGSVFVRPKSFIFVFVWLNLLSYNGIGIHHQKISYDPLSPCRGQSPFSKTKRVKIEYCLPDVVWPESAKSLRLRIPTITGEINTFPSCAFLSLETKIRPYAEIVDHMKFYGSRA